MSGKKGSKHVNSTSEFMKIIFNLAYEQNGCRIWPFGKDKDGYGYYTIKGKMFRSHRLLYLLSFPGHITDEVILHICDVRACCNLHHLRSGTISENTKDMVRKDRHVKGSAVGTSKLTVEQVLKIRESYPIKSSLELAKEYSVCRQTICNVINRMTYANASHVNERYEPVNKPIRIKL